MSIKGIGLPFLLLIFLFHIIGPFAIPLYDVGTYFKYEGDFYLEFLIPELYQIGEPSVEYIFNLTDYGIISGVITSRGYLMVMVENNYVDYITFSMEFIQTEPPNNTKYDLFKLGILKEGKYFFNVSRDMGLVKRGIYEIPFFLVWDMESMIRTLERYNEGFVIRTGDGYNFSIQGLTIREGVNTIELLGDYTVYMLPKIGNKTRVLALSLDEEVSIISIYSTSGYALEYRFYITPLILQGIGIYFWGKLIETNATEKVNSLSLIDLLDSLREYLTNIFGPLGNVFFIVLLILIISSILSLIVFFLKRLGRV